MGRSAPAQPLGIGHQCCMRCGGAQVLIWDGAPADAWRADTPPHAVAARDASDARTEPAASPCRWARRAVVAIGLAWRCGAVAPAR